MNDFEIAARLAKAEKLRDLLMHRGYTTRSVHLLTERLWLEAAQTSGCAGANNDRVPSVETRACVKALMADMERDSLRGVA